MSETQELKLACLHHAGGDLDKAKAHYEWVIGSAPEASEQRATDQPEQPFNYRHPSKHDGSMPRRCYLDQLTPEELMIRDVAATVEGLGAHPLLTATVIKLMQAGEALADWVDIGLRDKAIQALLDPVPSPSPESSSQETVGYIPTERSEIEAMQAEAAAEAAIAQERKEIEEARELVLSETMKLGYEAFGNGVSFEENPHNTPATRMGWARGWCEAQSRIGEHTSDCALWNLPAFEPLPCTCGGIEAPTDAERTAVVTDHDRVEPEIPEGFTRWEGGECPVPAGCDCEVIYHHPKMQPEYVRAGAIANPSSLNWSGKDQPMNYGIKYAVVAYRVIEAKPAETPPPVSELDSQETPQASIEQSQENPAAQMFGKALAAESEAKEQRKYNPFAIFGKVGA